VDKTHHQGIKKIKNNFFDQYFVSQHKSQGFDFQIRTFILLKPTLKHSHVFESPWTPWIGFRFHTCVGPGFDSHAQTIG
jgi:hypothetical protein